MIWVAAAVVALIVVVLLVRMLSGGESAKPDERETKTRKAAEARRKKTPADPSPESEPASSAPAHPMSVPPPANDFDDDWDDVDITMVAELPEEIKALQKGYRAVDPKQAVAEVTKPEAREAAKAAIVAKAAESSAAEELGITIDVDEEAVAALSRPPEREKHGEGGEIEVLDEQMIDELLVEELLTDEDTGPNALVLVEGLVRTDQGRRRPNNEDRPVELPEYLVYGVADGMGGHAAGEVASAIAAETMEKAFAENRFEGPPHNLWPRRGDELARTIEMANRNIFEAACEDDSLTGMGTTLTAIRFCPERQRAYIAHVGDSRCYRVRDGGLMQLTRDHTLGAELGAKGKMATHLSRSVGISETVEVDLMVAAPKPGDRYVLCTDGLTKMLSEERILEIVREGEIDACVQQLIDEANENGGKDNVTIALVEIREPSPSDLG